MNHGLILTDFQSLLTQPRKEIICERLVVIGSFTIQIPGRLLPTAIVIVNLTPPTKVPTEAPTHDCGVSNSGIRARTTEYVDYSGHTLK